MSETIPTVRVDSLSGAKRKLLEKLRQSGVCERSEFPLTRRTDHEPAPLSLMQEQLWLQETNTPGIPPLYNESITLRLRHATDIEVLERSVAEVVRRHEIWRTSYDTIAGRPVQAIHPAETHFSLPCVDLRRMSPTERDGEVLQLGLAQAARPFDLRNGPLLRAAVSIMSDAELWLIMTAHQSVVDGLSVYQIFPSELSTIYAAFSAGRQSPLPELRFQFSDFAFWQREWLTSARRSHQIAHWRKKLSAEASVLRWPVNKARPARRNFCGAMRSFALSPRAVTAVREIKKREGATLFGIVLATFCVFLFHYSEQSDLIVGTFSPAGRKRSEVSGLLGYFLNPVALRIDLSDGPPFSELLRRVREVYSEAISNDDVPFEDIVQALSPPLDHSRNPYFTVGISVQPSMPEHNEGWSVTSMDAENGGSKLDLYIAFIERVGQLHVRAQYNPDLFDFGEMERMISDFNAVLEGAARFPEKRVSELLCT